MLILALNTAFTTMEAALVRDGEILADARETLPRGQEKALPGFVEAQLKEEGASFADVARLAVVTGPGSFTGLRIDKGNLEPVSNPLGKFTTPTIIRRQLSQRLLPGIDHGRGIGSIGTPIRSRHLRPIE